MRAMVLRPPETKLTLVEREVPIAGPGQLVARVLACGVCRTDLHVVDGELPDVPAEIVPGHEVVARVTSVGIGVDDFWPGERIGVPWLGHACGSCPYCRSERENLCDAPGFTGYGIDGGYADYVRADARFCVALPDAYDDVEAAPLLCAGLIGHRALKLAGPGERLGLYGFGAAAHIVAQLARFEGRRVYAFTRPGDEAAQAFATSLGAVWAGDSTTAAPEPLDAAIIFAPVGALVPKALADVAKGGMVVTGGIHMSDIPGFAYDLLWGERQLRSVANLTREDAREFMALAPRAGVRCHVTPYPLEAANQALDDLRAGRLEGAAVLVP